MLTIKAMTGGERYAANHLCNNDYYAEGEAVTGEWMGRGAELLGLEGAVTMEQFDATTQGVNPATGEFLRPRQSADRYASVERDGIFNIERVATARNLYDFTISAPKDISIQALEDPRLVEVHNIAAAETVKEMERLASTRVRKWGANENRFTSNLVISAWKHNTSRELDPQIHTHFVAGNLTYDGVEQKWKALQASEIYAEREYLSEVYRNVAAREMLARGYEIEDRFEHGQDRGFGIVGIKQATREKYSQRSAQRDAAIAEFIEKNGRPPSNNEIARLVRDTRDEKLTEISTDDVRAGQLSRLDAEETRTLRELHQAALDRGPRREEFSAAASLNHAREHIFERVSVAKDYELLTIALRHGRGRVEIRDLKAELLKQVASGEMLTARGEVATTDSLKRERWMVATINEGADKYEPLGRGREFVVSDRLRPEQKAAVLAVLDSRDRAINLRGAAGTGKTATLQELHRGLTEARRSAVAVAPTVSAVEELGKVGFQSPMTIAHLLASANVQRQLTSGEVLIVDEAGMVGSKDMEALIDLAKDKDLRIVYSGDTAQIKSLLEGDALRVLERESNLKNVSLLQVQRQTNPEYKAAVEALRIHPAEGYSRLEAMGAIRQVNWLLRSQEVSKAYRQAAAVPNRSGESRSVLVVAATHDEIKSATYAIREDRKLAGELGRGETVSHHTPLNWTDAQKKQGTSYQPGMILESANPQKIQAVEVVRVDKNRIRVRLTDGKTKELSPKDMVGLSVFEKQDIEVAAGDKLLLQANWRSKGKDEFRATNGELVTVSEVKGGRIKLEDGRELPENYRQFTHGYAVTAHRSQGKTVDYEIIAAEHMAQDLFYVSATRAREGLTVITSDSIGLQESIGVSGDRQSAIELERRAASVATSAKSFTNDDLFRAYQAHQAQTRAGKTSIQQETKQHDTNQNTGTRIRF